MCPLLGVSAQGGSTVLGLCVCLLLNTARGVASNEAEEAVASSLFCERAHALHSKSWVKIMHAFFSEFDKWQN